MIHTKNLVLQVERENADPAAATLDKEAVGWMQQSLSPFLTCSDRGRRASERAANQTGRALANELPRSETPESEPSPPSPSVGNGNGRVSISSHDGFAVANSSSPIRLLLPLSNVDALSKVESNDTSVGVQQWKANNLDQQWKAEKQRKLLEEDRDRLQAELLSQKQAFEQQLQEQRHATEKLLKEEAEIRKAEIRKIKNDILKKVPPLCPPSAAAITPTASTSQFSSRQNPENNGSGKSGLTQPMRGFDLRRLHLSESEDTPWLSDNEEKRSKSELERDNLAHMKGTCMGKKAWLYPDLPWGAPPEAEKKWSTALFLNTWEVLCFVCCLYVAFSVPYNVSFAEKSRRILSQESGIEFDECVFMRPAGQSQDSVLFKFSPMQYVMTIIDVSTDCIFFVDILINFHTAVWELSINLPPERGFKGPPHWILLEDLSEIRKRYFYGEFLSDLLGQIPWQYADCFTEGMPGLKILRVFRLLKMLRLYRLKRMLEGLYRKYPKCKIPITGVELMLTMVIVTHWVSCGWFLVGYPTELPADGWVFAEGIVDENLVQNNEPGSRYFEWITAFYWAMTTMSTIGYGDIPARTWQERTVAVIVMWLGCAFFAWITGRITHLLTKESICVISFENTMQEMMEWMEARALSPEIVERIKNFYRIRYPTSKIFNESKILADLPVSLRKEAYVELYYDIVSHVPIFSICELHTQREICYRLRIVFRSAGLAITSEGQVPDALYIVRFGVVDLYSSKQFLKSLGRGDIFGENALLGLTKNGLRTRTAVARTMVELCELQHEDFFNLFVEVEDFNAKMSHMTNGFLQYLETAVQESIPIARKDYLCTCWKIVADDYLEELSQKEDRDRKSNPDLGSYIKGALCTKLNVHMATIKANRAELASEKEASVLNIRWPGHASIRGIDFAEVENEGPLIYLNASHAKAPPLSIHQTVSMTLWHDDVDWESMPDVEISLWKSSQSNQVVYSPRRFTVEKEPATPRGSWGQSVKHSHEKDKADTDESPFEIFVHDVRGVTVNGYRNHKEEFASRWEKTASIHIPIADLIRKRSSMVTRSNYWDVVLEPERIAYNPATYTINLATSVVRRVPADSIWRRVLRVLQANSHTTGSYFGQVLRKNIGHMRGHASRFHLHVAWERKKRAAKIRNEVREKNINPYHIAAKYTGALVAENPYDRVFRDERGPRIKGSGSQHLLSDQSPTDKADPPSRPSERISRSCSRNLQAESSGKFTSGVENELNTGVLKTMGSDFEDNLPAARDGHSPELSARVDELSASVDRLLNLESAREERERRMYEMLEGIYEEQKQRTRIAKDGW